MPTLLGALNHCHVQNIIHRDIKPANIMFDKTGEIKFIDFGVAVAKTKQNVKLDLTGSPIFMSPEIFSGNYGKETDIWSLGVTMFNLASADYPFDLKDGESFNDLVLKIFS